MPSSQPTPVQRLKARMHRLLVDLGEAGHSRVPTRLQLVFHFVLLAMESFTRNRLPIRAASLSYTTILALVPFLAVALGITSSFLKNESEERIAQFVDQLVGSVVPPAILTNSPPPDDSPSTSEPPPAEGAASAGQGAVAAPVEAIATTSGPSLGGETGVLTNAPVFKPRVLDANVQDDVARSIRTFMQNTRSGTLGLVGTAALVFLAISMLIRIEDAFNEVWGVRKGRGWFMRLVLYWSVISLAPVLVVVVVGLATGPHLATTQRLIGGIPLVGWLLFQLLPVVVLCLAFAVFYRLMPNTRVRWNAALMGGVVAAVLWHANNSLSALYVSRVVTNFKIYGSIGLVPVFMIGLYFAWMILLFGGQVSYAWQNRLAYFQERISDNVNQRCREFVALRLMTAISAAYQRGQDPPSEAQMAEALEIPPRLVQQVVRTLVTARLLTEVSGSEPAYVPARPTGSINCHDVLLAMRTGQGRDLTVQDEPLHRQILGEFQRINDAERRAAESVSIQVLADRANALMAFAPERLPSETGERT